MTEEELLRNFLCGEAKTNNVDVSDHLHTLWTLLFGCVAANQTSQNTSPSSQEHPLSADTAADAPAPQSTATSMSEGTSYSQDSANGYTLKDRPYQSLNLQPDGDVWSGNIYLYGEEFPATWCRKTGRFLTAKKSANEDINHAFEMRQARSEFDLISYVPKKIKESVDKEAPAANYLRENIALKEELEIAHEALKVCQDNIRFAREEINEARTSVAVWRDKCNRAEIMLSRKSIELIEAAHQKTELLKKISQLEETVRELKRTNAALTQKMTGIKGSGSF